MDRWRRKTHNKLKTYTTSPSVSQKELANARTLRMDGLFERFAVAKSKRVEVYGKRLEIGQRIVREDEYGMLRSLLLTYYENRAVLEVR